MHTLFVTGASGFIGTHLVRELVRRGMHCKCLIRATSSIDALPTDGVEFVQGSLEEPESYRAALVGCDTVIHLAGVIFGLNETQLNRVNAESCAHLADACLAIRQPPRLVFISSVAAAGPPPAGVAIRDETHAPHPISFYGRSKRRGELLLTERADRLPITIIRPGIVFGPGDQNLADLFRSIIRWRLHVVAGFRTPPLSLIYVEDLVQLILLAVERGETLRPNPACSEGYYIACDDSEFPNYWEFGQRIARSVDQKVFVWPLWRWVAKCVGLAAQTAAKMSGRPSLLTLDKVREGTVRSWASSSQKARHQLGFAPTKSLDDYLRETSRWYIDNRRI